MKLLKLLTAPLCLVLLLQVEATAQNVFNPADVNVNFNESATLGTAQKPFLPPNNTLAKWGRVQNLSRIGWGADDFKCYIFNGMQFRLRYPNNYNPNNATKYPLVLFFHGLGEARVSDYENEDQLYHGAVDFRNRINDGSWNGFLLFPQVPGLWDNNTYPDINKVLDSLEKYCNFDPDELITMGLSSGGFGSIDYASLYPKRVASIISSTPRSTNNYSSSYLEIPINVSNGGQDGAPNPYQVNTFVSDFRNNGGDVYQIYYVDNGHDTWYKQWFQTDVANNYNMVKAWNAAHKAQPLLYYGHGTFCNGSPISAKMGITAGFNTYEWQRDGGGGFTTIPGATSNTYIATQTGSYRVRFKRTATSAFSAWTPTPIVISTKSCSSDTAFVQDFDDESTLYYSAAASLQNYNFTPCQNGVVITANEAFSADATGRQGGRFISNWTKASAGNCTYAAGDRIWGNINAINVTQNTYYQLNFYLGNNSATSVAQIVPSVNGTVIGPAVSAAGVGMPSWTKFSFRWFSGNATTAYISLNNSNANTTGNDYVFDEISLVKLPFQPGGVGDNLVLWAKADAFADNTKLPFWENLAGNKDLLQPDVTRQPAVKNNAADNINFNPVVNFPGTNNTQFYATGGFSGTTAHTGVNAFTVIAPNNNTQVASLLEEDQASLGVVNISTPAATNFIWNAGSTAATNTVTTPFAAADIAKPILWTFSKDAAGTTPNGNKQDIRKNGLVQASNNTSVAFTGNGSTMTIGSGNTNLLNARVAEIIYFLDGTMTAAKQNSIESYLAVKYGLTLGSVASPVNYTASDATIIWNGPAAYQNDVFGVGRDDLSGLLQTQSNSMNSGSGDGTGQALKGNLLLSTLTALNNKQFLLIGNDAGSMVETTITSGQAQPILTGSRRVQRNWRVKNTGNIGGVTLSVDRNGLTFTGGNIIGNYRLMIDTDGDGNYATGPQTFFPPTAVTAQRVTFNGVSLPNNAVFTLITLLSAGAALPIELTDFRVIKQGEKAALSWTTATEINNKQFEIEHSTDGLNFTKIGTVLSQGNSTSVRNYSFTHALPARGINYYRLKQVDLDDQSKNSPVRSVIFGKSAQLIVYPNPTKGRVVIQSGEVLTMISVFNTAGQRLIQERTTGATSGTVYEINVSSLTRGIYIMQLTQADGTVKNVKLEKE